MHFFKTFVFASVLCASSAVLAAQPLSGMYIGGFGGGNFFKAKVEPNRAFGYPSESYHDMGLHAGLQAGARIMSVRIAGEASINTKTDLDAYDLKGYNYGLQLYYDVPFKSAFRPYVNIGYNKYKTELSTDPGLETTKKQWAMNYGGGFTVALTRRTNLDLGYRFINLGTIRLINGDNDRIPVKLMQHQLYMGFRYVI